jgi:hypothetical protein
VIPLVKKPVLLIVLFAFAIFFSALPAEAAIPVPPGFKTTSPLDQPDMPPLRSNSFKATLEDRQAPAGITEISYHYQAVLLNDQMIDAGLADSLQKDIRNEEARLSEDKNYVGKEAFLGGTLLLVRVPPRGNEMGGAGKPEYYNAVYYEKLGRGKLRIEMSGVVGGLGRVKELTDFMQKGTNAAY